MSEFLPQVAEYLKLTGQDIQYLMSGTVQFGSDFVFYDLVERALREKKKIIWFPDPDTDPQLALLSYRFESL